MNSLFYSRPLPEKFSDAIELTIQDTQKISKDPKFKLDMTYWIMQSPKTNICHVNLSGVVMLCCGLDQSKIFNSSRQGFVEFSPSDYVRNLSVTSIERGRIWCKLISFEELRLGRIEAAILGYTGEHHKHIPWEDVNYPDYYWNNRSDWEIVKGWHESKVIPFLRKHNL